MDSLGSRKMKDVFNLFVSHVIPLKKTRKH